VGGGGAGVATGSAADGVLGGLTRSFTALVARTDAPAWAGPLAVVLAVVLGAGHALLPGHGKTVMAAYLAGRRGTRRDALVVGATVTATHTAGVLLLGLGVSVSSAFAPEGVLRWLGVVSGLLVAGIGVVLLRSAVRPREVVYAGFHDHHHDHGHGHGHSHAPPRFGRGALVGLGIAGGLVPSPTALVVLLGAVGLGRTWFGVGLVLAYGLGMAATLTAAGLLLVGLRDRIDRLPLADALRHRAARLTPLLTSALVLAVGVGLTLRSLAGAV
jgi:ABC-type nickel/cobalt efflux system permease component RcnA